VLLDTGIWCYHDGYCNTDMGPAWRALTHHAVVLRAARASFVRGRHRIRQMGSCDIDPGMVVHGYPSHCIKYPWLEIVGCTLESIETPLVVGD